MAADGRTGEIAGVFSHDIRVRWADCDPAKIAYTGRIPCFALEAIDAWWEHNFGDDWFAMNVDRDRGVPFVHLSVDFKAPVTPRHVLECAVRVLKAGESSVRFSVVGRQDGTVCFEGEFVEVFVVASTFRKMPFPEPMRDRLTGLSKAAGCD